MNRQQTKVMAEIELNIGQHVIRCAQEPIQENDSNAEY